MVPLSIADAPAALFNGDVPSFEEIKKLGRIVNASERSRIAFRADSEKHKDALRCGLGLLLCGETDAAAEKLEQGSDCPQKWMALGTLYRRQKRYDEAIKQFNKAAKAGADALSTAMEKCQTYWLAQDAEKAEKELNQCSNYENVSAAYHYHRGLLCDMQGDYEQAMAHYAKAVELDPDHEAALFQLAYACDLRGDEELAIEYYKQLASHVPPPVNALLNLAVLHEDRGEYDSAEICVNRVLASHPNHAKAALFCKDIDSSRHMVYDEEKEKRRNRHNKILEIPISDFELSVRSRNCLKKMNINTLGDLLRTTEAELLAYKNFGETSLVEIKKILDSKNLRLGMALEDGTASNPSSASSEQDDPESQIDSELLAKGIDELELSVRSRRALERLDINTFHDLVTKSEPELLGCKNFGVTSLNEVKEKLAKFELTLRKSD